MTMMKPAALLILFVSCFAEQIQGKEFLFTEKNENPAIETANVVQQKQLDKKLKPATAANEALVEVSKSLKSNDGPAAANNHNNLRASCPNSCSKNRVYSGTCTYGKNTALWGTFPTVDGKCTYGCCSNTGDDCCKGRCANTCSKTNVYTGTCQYGKNTALWGSYPTTDGKCTYGCCSSTGNDCCVSNAPKCANTCNQPYIYSGASCNSPYTQTPGLWGSFPTKDGKCTYGCCAGDDPEVCCQ